MNLKFNKNPIKSRLQIKIIIKINKKSYPRKRIQNQNKDQIKKKIYKIKKTKLIQLVKNNINLLNKQKNKRVIKTIKKISFRMIKSIIKNLNKNQLINQKPKKRQVNRTIIKKLKIKN